MRGGQSGIRELGPEGCRFGKIRSLVGGRQAAESVIADDGLSERGIFGLVEVNVRRGCIAVNAVMHQTWSRQPDLAAEYSRYGYCGLYALLKREGQRSTASGSSNSTERWVCFRTVALFTVAIFVFASVTPSNGGLTL